MAKTSGLTKHQLEIISKVASQEAVMFVERKEKRAKEEQRQRNLKNTELLLKNYTKLKVMAEEYKNEVDEYEDSVLDLSTLSLETLEKYHFKTVKMMKHVDVMLKAYERNCESSLVEEQRRYKVLKYRYLVDEKMTVKQLCDKLHVDQRTIYRDTKYAIHDMSVLLFGTAAIDFI